MVLNGLGFATRRLYLTPHFFQNKPTEQLVGTGITAEMLNDDTLGKALDQLHGYGVSELYSVIAAQAVTRLGLRPTVGHQDITSFHTDGQYNSATPPDPDARVVHITRGYSRDRKADLNQVALELIHEHQASLPVALHVLDGNQNDQQTMGTSVGTHIEQLRAVGIGMLVKDSAGYSDTALQAHEAAGLTWITRVPATLAAVKTLVEETDPTTLQALAEGYRYRKVSSNYAGVPQRWLLIHSDAAMARASKTVTRHLLKTTEQERKAFAQLCRQDFACEQDATGALEALQNDLKVLRVHEARVVGTAHFARAGRPSQDRAPDRISYQIQGLLVTPLSHYQQVLTRAALFVLATNELDAELVTDAELLATYKAQSISERGFRFLKDPMFLAATLFLKKVERIMALLMVMTVCLLVYAALEHRIRTSLATGGGSVPDQKGSPTQKPTARWVFELFLDVHLLSVITGTTEVMTMNLKEELRMLLGLLGSAYQKAYP